MQVGDRVSFMWFDRLMNGRIVSQLHKADYWEVYDGLSGNYWEVHTVNLHPLVADEPALIAETLKSYRAMLKDLTET